MRIEWTARAKRDIQQIRDYIAEDSVFYANRFVRKLLAAPERLITHPQSGRMIPELADPAFREVIFEKYRVMYTVENDVVYITQVRHGARQYP